MPRPFTQAKHPMHHPVLIITFQTLYCKRDDKCFRTQAKMAKTVLLTNPLHTVQLAQTVISKFAFSAKKKLLLLSGKVVQKSSLAQFFCAQGKAVSGSYHLQLILPFLSVFGYCIYFFNAHHQITAFFLIKLVSSIQSLSVIPKNKDMAIKPKAHYRLS